MRRIIQCVQNDNDNVSAKDTIYAIKNAGFNDVFIQWYDKDWEVSQQEQVDLCKELGFSIEFAHLGYKGINDIWVDGESGDNLVCKYLKNLDECKENSIPMVVMHLTTHSIAPAPSKIGIKRLQKIIDYAEKLQIKVAFENTKIFGYLEYVFKYIKNKNVGVCFDSGHYHCHFNDKFNWEMFKDKVFAVHLHDNDKSGDQHLLPFDGTIDWKKLWGNLKNANYNGPITMESCYSYPYLKQSVKDFYKLSFDRAKLIEKL